MDKNKNYLNLKKFSQSQGIDLFGVADISRIKKDFLLDKKVVKKFNQAICLGLVLSESVLEEISQAPTRLYSYHYKAINTFLDLVALKVCSYIRQKGFLSLPIPASQVLDWQKQTAHLSHKKIGYLAGLGWMGRNNLLVNRALGSQFRLVSILTNMPLKIDTPTKNDCRDCYLCVKICPCGAIKNNVSEFGHIRCFEKLKEFQKQRLVEQYICGVCVKACKAKI